MGSIYGAMEFVKVTLTTAVATTVSLGYIPRYVRIVNVTDSVSFEWFYDADGNGMTDGTAWLWATAGDQSLQAANGITAYAGTSTAAAGVTLGTAIGGTSDTVYMIAIR